MQSPASTPLTAFRAGDRTYFYPSVEISKPESIDLDDEIELALTWLASGCYCCEGLMTEH